MFEECDLGKFVSWTVLERVPVATTRVQSVPTCRPLPCGRRRGSLLRPWSLEPYVSFRARVVNAKTLTQSRFPWRLGVFAPLRSLPGGGSQRKGSRAQGRKGGQTTEVRGQRSASDLCRSVRICGRSDLFPFCAFCALLRPSPWSAVTPLEQSSETNRGIRGLRGREGNSLFLFPWRLGAFAPLRSLPGEGSQRNGATAPGR